MYERFGKEVEFKRSIKKDWGQMMQELDYFIEELGRHRRREGKSEWVLCESVNVVHVLWECSAYIVILESSLWRSFRSF